MIIYDIIPPEKRKQISYLPKPRQVKKASKKALSVLLIAFLLIQIIAGPFIPFNFSQNPPRVSLQEARADGTPIATCAELQNMENDLTASYYLTNDIDCSDTTTWNSGQGFRPVGYYEATTWSEFHFTGSFDGQGYKITNLYMNWVEIDGVYVGGLFGFAKDAIIENVGLENVNINIEHSEWGIAGALVGYTESITTISNSYSTGSVSSTDQTGGFVGSNCTGDTISNSYSTCSVSGYSSIGGLVGDNYGAISNSYSTGSISGTTDVGGFVGTNHSSTISNSYSTGSVSGTTNVGGFVGTSSGTISNSYSTGSVSGTTYVGGFVGFSVATISNSYSTGSVSGATNVGGFAGRNGGGATISNSYSTGSVSGTDRVGGLVGYNSDSATISNSYSTGSVSGTDRVGGLVGYNSDSATISNSYSTGSVSGSTNVGGFVGINSATISNSFWDTQTSGQAASAGGTGKTTTEMKNVRTFTDTAWSAGLTAPWDFVGDPYDDVGAEDIWNIDNTAEKNNGYSFLSWQNASPNVPTLVSPADSSFTSDNTPALSAVYSDSNDGDTGTTDYRIATSSANCLSGTVVATGTSAATSSNNATTTWTPDSSIGNDGTYYWCARNDDGVATSSWTAMGSFVLDTTGPTVSLSSPVNNGSISDNTPTLTWSGSDITSGIAKYQLYVDNSLNTDNISSSATSVIPTNSLSCGIRTWHIRAYDNANNYTDSSVFNLTMVCGSGLPPSAFNPPALPEPTPENPEGGFSVLINNDDEYTDNQTVTLKLSAGKDTKRMAISNTEDFKYASQVPYQEEISWELCNGREDICKNLALHVTGYTLQVYAKFYTQYGVASEVVSDSIILKTIITETGTEETANTETEEQTEDSNQEEPASETKDNKDSESSNDLEFDKTNPSESSSFIFTKPLKLGSFGTEVTQLQNKLKELNLFSKDIESNNNFDLTTKNAVKEYQTSKGIYPCGIVGPRTRKALNNEEFITNKDYKFTQDLKYNDKSEEVKQLQTRLRDQNFFPYNIQSTSWFGPVTQKAVNIFQKFYNLIQSGVVDEGMRGVLNR